ncbi:MAG: hypothetical protein GXP54_01110 [Deltaproteobacteria bacterium]|nr:hypothetical protein [Deltaproteobacteria bacterium]
MKRLAASLIPVMCVSLGCANTNNAETDTLDATGPDIAELPPFDENPAHILFDLFADPVDAPFPYNYYMDPINGGIRIREGAFTNSLLPMIDTFPKFVEEFGQADGFATYAPLSFLASVPLDPDSLPADEETTLKPDSPVRLLELDASGEPVAQVPLRIEYRQMDSQDGPRYVVSAVPMQLLKTGTTYLYVATDAVMSAAGEHLGRSQGFAEILGTVKVRGTDPERAGLVLKERERLAPLVLKLENAEHVIAAVDFTTGLAGQETYEIMSLFNKGGKYQTVAWDLDGDDDGTDDVAWGEEYKECPMSSDDMSYGVYGTFENVNFTGPDEQFVKKDGVWQTFAPEDLEFWLMVPSGTGPFPVVVMTHGIASDQHQLCNVSRDLVKAKIATLRFILPRHGRRGGGSMDFLDLTDPFKIRDNFRQGGADIASTTLLIESLSKGLDLLPKGAPDGKGDLDGTRIGLLGHSLGAIIGAEYLAFSDRIHCAVLNVGGVGLTHMVEAYVLPDSGPGGFYEVMGLVNGAPHLIWPADGVTYAHHIISDPLDGVVKDILMHEHMNDDTVPNVTTELLARFASIPLVEPADGAVLKHVEGVAEKPADQTTSGVWQVDGVSHGAFPGSTANPKIALERKQAVHFLKTYFETGKPEILVQ